MISGAQLPCGESGGIPWKLPEQFFEPLARAKLQATFGGLAE
jgi:hypothetical protein